MQSRILGSNPWVRKVPWRREWQPTPVFLLGEFHGQRSLAGYGPWGCKESVTWVTNTFTSMAVGLVKATASLATFSRTAVKMASGQLSTEGFSHLGNWLKVRSRTPSAKCEPDKWSHHSYTWLISAPETTKKVQIIKPFCFAYLSQCRYCERLRFWCLLKHQSSAQS